MDEKATALIAAVRSGDAAAVGALLEAGADAEATDEHGTPLLCLAVDTFDLSVVDPLLSWGVRLDRPAGDGRTPLLRAVGLGAYGIAQALISRGASLRFRDADGRDALALARHWHETGAEAELRRRSGAPGPAGRRILSTDTDTTCEELSLGGLTVRTGHTAILTELEPRYGITVGFEELLSRALAEPDVEREVWWAALSTLQKRAEAAVWDAAAALRERPDPLARYFGARLLHLVIVLDDSEDETFDRPLVDVLLPWAAQEEDVRVMRALAAALADAFDDRAARPLPALARHADAEVRGWAVSGLYGQVSRGHPEALAAAAACTRDPAAEVRGHACRVLGQAPAGSTAASDALAACLCDRDEAVRVQAAVRLALRDDPRADEVLDGLGAVDGTSPYYWDLDSVWRHRERSATQTPGAGAAPGAANS
ncbi:HEAT repeat domain-containing protein [Streptomyces sp. MST-110588]|uniref:HEAT repeat domain-containing protein n=1 Tax=Streptomyces sp. MST-110588 TaxID=2833628 RepID=UPI001F5DFD2C|nr:HEAT repeat domain-containing protein [Streptomyces sp. MST-110588]UNO39077.1 hypothetical protein KGS77_04830 [Streptomyces sp. MST-110588]